MKILVLAKSGFGKSTSIGRTLNEEKGINIKGLNPEETYLISMTTKDLPFPGSRKSYPSTLPTNLRGGRRALCKNAQDVLTALQGLAGSSKVKHIVLDDFNYIMQDWFMANALAKGWDAPKQIGYFMGLIFDAIENLDALGKNIIVLAHGEDVNQPDGRIYTKMKTTGKMVDEYITPEGKFNVVLVGSSRYDSASKRVVKEFVTEENETYASPKNGGVPFPTTIPNDLGLVVDQLEAFYNGDFFNE